MVLERPRRRLPQETAVSVAAATARGERGTLPAARPETGRPYNSMRMR